MMPELMDTVGMVAGVVITLAIFSYLLGDTPLYRWALAILVGVGIGYAVAVAANFLFRWGLDTLSGAQARWIAIPPLILGILLLFKWFPRLAPLGNIAMAFMLGVGIAVAISGALLGTLLPQMWLTARGVSPEVGSGAALLKGVFVLLGTIVALLAFSPRPVLLGGRQAVFLQLQRMGRVFILIALATAFAGAVTTGLTLFIERWGVLLNFFIEQLPTLLGPGVSG